MYLTRFKSMAQTLMLAGGDHILVSNSMIGKNFHESTHDEIEIEKETFMAT